MRIQNKQKIPIITGRSGFKIQPASKRRPGAYTKKQAILLKKKLDKAISTNKLNELCDELGYKDYRIMKACIRTLTKKWRIKND